MSERAVRTELPGPESRRLLDAAEAIEGPTVARQPTIAWESARGVHVQDADGNVFLDFTSSVLVANVGHAHPRIVEAIRDQAGQLLHSYNFVNRWRVELETRLSEIGRPHGLERVFIATTGAEVVELALKLARYASGRGGTLALEGGYHGKTLAATAVGGRAESVRGLGELLPGVVRLPFPAVGDDAAKSAMLERLESLDGAADIGTVIVESFQGNAGQRMPSVPAMRRIEEWTREHDAVLIADETQSAFGRTGTLFAFEQLGIRPDLVVAGKGISSSLPLTVMLGRREIFDAAPPRALSSTHGGNPMSCRAACTVLDILREENLLANSAEVGGYITSALRDAAASAGIEADVRGSGMMIGIDVRDGSGAPDPARARAIVDCTLKRGVLLLAPIGLDKNVVRVSPPLCLSSEQAREGVAAIAEAMAEAA